MPNQTRTDIQNRHLYTDIKKIDNALTLDSQEEMKKLHVMLDAKYSAYIPKWGHSTFGYSAELGYDDELLSGDALKYNLSIMKAMLEGYLLGFPVASTVTQGNHINVNVNNNNQVNIDVSFEQTKQMIEDMPGLTDADTEEIKSKIDELKSLSNEPLQKKKKWEKIKPILLFAVDKGADVGLAIMNLVLQMKLGM